MKRSAAENEGVGIRVNSQTGVQYQKTSSSELLQVDRRISTAVAVMKTLDQTVVVKISSHKLQVVTERWTIQLQTETG